jgi:flagellar hook-associated protein 1 FlgK
MSINSIYSIANSSIAAQRAALEITSENIANVNTPGYSRQRANLVSAPVTNSNGFPLGNGVAVSSVQRFYDASLQKNIVDNTSLLSNNQTRQSSLQQIEPVFNELSGDGLGKAMQDFFDAWQGLSANPAGAPERQTVLTRAQILADTFQQANDNLSSVQNNANLSLGGIATDITDKARSIASLNEQISKLELGGGGSANELRDQRDLLIQDLSKKVGVSFTEESDHTVTITLPGGSELVQGSRYATVYSATPPQNSGISLGPNAALPDNHIYITAMGNPPPAVNSSLNTDMTSVIGGPQNSQGELGAMLTIRDATVPAYLRKLDELAYSLADQVNTQHKLGWNLNNTNGGDFFNPATTVNTITGLTSTAGFLVGDSVSGPGIPFGTTIGRIDSTTQITLAPPLTQAASGSIQSYIFPSGAQSGTAVSTEGFSRTISLNITSTNEIAAADANPLTGGSGNNRNALAIAAVSYNPVTFSDGSTTSVTSSYNALASSVGADVLAIQNATSQKESFVKQLTTLRESNSGVSMDEELANMIKYQKAFQGAAKLITTATDMMDTVLGMVR